MCRQSSACLLVADILAIGAQICILGVMCGAHNIKLHTELGNVYHSSIGLAALITGFISAQNLAWFMFALNMAVGLGFLAAILYQFLTTKQTNTLLLVSTGQPPDLVLNASNRYHLFLSHIWSSEA